MQSYQQRFRDSAHPPLIWVKSSPVSHSSNRQISKAAAPIRSRSCLKEAASKREFNSLTERSRRQWPLLAVTTSWETACSSKAGHRLQLIYDLRNRNKLFTALSPL